LKTLDFQYNAVHAPDVEQHEVQPVVARTIEEVLAGVQGQYNFLQDSMLDLEGTFYGFCCSLVTNHGVVWSR